MLRAVLFASVVSVIASSASAQVFYEPVKYQYSSGGTYYYYGGSDPQVHRDAKELSHERGFGRTEGYAFHSGTIDVHREVVTEPVRVFTDEIPYWNARFFGYTVDDARNAAYQNSATFFRKADLARLARVQADGTWSVSANASVRGTIDIRPVAPAVRPVTEPKPILIIPKRLLDKKLWGEPLQSADAR
jgi:hypothetical protein